MPSFIIKPVQYNPRRRVWEPCPAERAPSFAVIELTPNGERPVGYGATREEARNLRDNLIQAEAH
ncbi:MAG: hypothetical protein Q8R98_08415 [Rubrivivax sp.]|nr:hypothetical protein [Rubrivivax sp.]